MRKSNLRYYVELVPGDETYRTYIDTKGKHYDHRFEFEIDFGPKFMRNGVLFNSGQVVAEPSKSNPIKEIILCVLFALFLLYITPCGGYEYNKVRWIGAILLSAIMGWLVGSINMSLQREQALAFNMS